MTLYRKNLKLSQELFTIISCFEITLRNKVDSVYRYAYGADWMKSAATSGMLDSNNCRHTKNIILQSLKKLNHNYTPAKLIAENPP